MQIFDITELDSRGVSLIQFVFVFPVLFVVVVGIIDFSRFLAVQAVLQKGAESGANYATKIPNLDINIDGLQATDDDYKIYDLVRKRVLKEAVRTPLSTLVGDIGAGNTSAKLVPFQYDDAQIVSGTPAPTPFDWGAAVLRPGDRVKDANGNWVAHNTVPPDAGGHPPRTPEESMKTEPIVVIMQADVKMFLPFLGTIRATGQATAYRETIPRGPVGLQPGEVLVTTTSTTTSSSVFTMPSTVTTTTGVDCSLADWSNCINLARIWGWPPQRPDPSNCSACISMGPPDGM
jgi:hypothetical protein